MSDCKLNENIIIIILLLYNPRL